MFFRILKSPVRLKCTGDFNGGNESFLHFISKNHTATDIVYNILPHDSASTDHDCLFPEFVHDQHT